ncbi:hypothetical protein CFIMG_004542RA [Ceratocystis fimbriata CBS 114723]|uniref:DUF7704 domain-containing protein n=1 Tax=Ceratocystis fimbriata CBS 114723 TaxID=1035309 RepID=A0A2C5WXN5_9PEZI|nr:hypothetical protein CFIMG_004542RA [Ceratocystis fimbriata CBS 114723]
MASNLPTFPRIVFTIFEPISLIGGFLSAALFPAWFVNAQLPFVLVGEVAGEAVPEGVPATAPAVSTPAAAFTWDDYSHPPHESCRPYGRFTAWKYLSPSCPSWGCRPNNNARDPRGARVFIGPMGC